MERQLSWWWRQQASSSLHLIWLFSFSILWITVVAVVVDAIPYQVTTQGFLKVLNRSEPLVLFRTKIGIQALTGNHTCIDDRNSVYYTVNKQIEYFSYSSEENYMMMITSDNEVCFRNLYKSDWNNAMQRDLRQECRTHDFKGSKLYGLSINHHVVFSITKDMLHFFSPVAPLCGNDLYRGQGGHGLREVRFLHVTNFVRKEDRILLAYENRLEEYTAGGEYLRTRPLADAGAAHQQETLISIDSDEGRENSYFFMFIQRGNESLLRRLNNTISGPAETIFSAPNTTALSIDVSSGLMAILLRERVDYVLVNLGGNGSNVVQPVHGNYILALRGSDPSADTDATLHLTYLCDGGLDLKEVIMVNRRKQRDIYYCEENEEACAALGRNKICDYESILSPHHQYRMDETRTAKELKMKVLFIAIYGGLTLLHLLCFTTAENNGQI